MFPTLTFQFVCAGQDVGQRVSLQDGEGCFLKLPGDVGKGQPHAWLQRRAARRLQGDQPLAASGLQRAIVGGQGDRFWRLGQPIAAFAPFICLNQIGARQQRQNAPQKDGVRANLPGQRRAGAGFARTT